MQKDMILQTQSSVQQSFKKKNKESKFDALGTMWNQTNFKTEHLWATDWPRMIPTFQATKRNLVQTPTVILKTRHNALLQNQKGKEAEEK